MTLTDCTVTGNSASAQGGGLVNLMGTMTLTDCTVTANSAGTLGGGLYNALNTVTLTACTVSGNSASNGGGLNNGDGTTTLTDTIVAGNTGIGGSSSDISGSAGGAVTGTYNLIGPGGSGGIAGGSGGNIVLPDLTTLGLATLGNYGGLTQTMALLPGSTAIRAGVVVSGLTNDQRGAPRPQSGSVDIGTFEDQGYTLALVSGSPQSTMVSQDFPAPLTASLTENYSIAPIPGTTIDFTAPTAGASSTLSSGSAVTNSSGVATITAIANAIAGSYDVTAGTSGGVSLVSFNLTNQTQPEFSALLNPTITYGTATVDFTGTLAIGSQSPAGETISVTLASQTDTPTIGTGGSFTATFDTALLHASSTAYAVNYTYTSDGAFLAASGTSQLKVSPAAITHSIGDDSHNYGTTADLVTDLGTTINTGINGQNLAIAYASSGNTSTAIVGTYDILGTPTDGSGLLSDYSLTLNPGVLTVNTAGAHDHRGQRGRATAVLFPSPAANSPIPDYSTVTPSPA